MAAPRRLPAVMLTVALSTTGCATFAHGSRERITITSSPPGAVVYVNGERAAATTPAVVDVSRRRRTTIRLERDGYEASELRLRRRGSRWLWLNLGVCLNPLAAQGVESGSQWLGIIAGCFGTLTAIDLLSGGAFAVQKNVEIPLRPTSGQTAVVPAGRRE